MRTDEVFHFWDEISRIITGEITIDIFIEGFNEALTKECTYLLEQRVIHGRGKKMKERNKRYKITKKVRQQRDKHINWYVKDAYWNCYGVDMPKKFPWRKWFKALKECENSVEKDK